MSGGLFNHIQCANCAEDLLAPNKINDLKAATEAIEDIAPGSMAAKDARATLERLQRLHLELDSVASNIAKLSDVIRAVDYALCSDLSEQDAHDAISAYSVLQSRNTSKVNND